MSFYRWSQETGLSDSLHHVREIMVSDLSIKAMGSGLATILLAIVEVSRSVLFAAVGLSWGFWMVLGYIASRENGEDFRIEKIVSGVHVLAAAVTAIWLCVVIAEAIGEGGVWAAWLPIVVQSWVLMGFSIKAFQKADQVVPGIHEFVVSHLPDLLERFVPRPQENGAREWERGPRGPRGPVGPRGPRGRESRPADSEANDP